MTYNQEASQVPSNQRHVWLGGGAFLGPNQSTWVKNISLKATDRTGETVPLLVFTREGIRLLSLSHPENFCSGWTRYKVPITRGGNRN